MILRTHRNGRVHASGLTASAMAEAAFMAGASTKKERSTRCSIVHPEKQEVLKLCPFRPYVKEVGFKTAALTWRI